MAKELYMNRLFTGENVQKVHKGENVQNLSSSDKEVNQILATLGVDEDMQAEKLYVAAGIACCYNCCRKQFATTQKS